MKAGSEKDVPLEIILGVGVAIRRDGCYLFGLRCSPLGFGTLGFPGGHLEPGEDPFACAARELFEETRLHLANARAEGWFSHVDGPQRFLTLYVAGDVDGIAQVREPTKCAGWQWLPYDECPGPLFAPPAGYFASVASVASKPRTTSA